MQLTNRVIVEAKKAYVGNNYKIETKTKKRKTSQMTDSARIMHEFEHENLLKD